MRPDNTNTSPDQRFFYPRHGAVEHHDSLDVDSLPGVINVGNETAYDNHSYVVIETEGGKEEAIRLAQSHDTIPAGATLLQVCSLSNDMAQRDSYPSYIEEEDLDSYLEDSGAYDPHAEPGVLAMVQLDMMQVRGNHGDPRFDERGIGFLPVDEPLPALPAQALRYPHSMTQYNLLGFITPADKLVTWSPSVGYNTLLVDWCVANAEKQNELEAALLWRALPVDGHLVGYLDSSRTAQVYLDYYDKKHGTRYLADEDPRFHTGARFPTLTEADRERFDFLVDLASKHKAWS